MAKILKVICIFLFIGACENNSADNFSCEDICACKLSDYFNLEYPIQELEYTLLPIDTFKITFKKNDREAKTDSQKAFLLGMELARFRFASICKTNWNDDLIIKLLKSFNIDSIIKFQRLEELVFKKELSISESDELIEYYKKLEKVDEYLYKNGKHELTYYISLGFWSESMKTLIKYRKILENGEGIILSNGILPVLLSECSRKRSISDDIVLNELKKIKRVYSKIIVKYPPQFNCGNTLMLGAQLEKEESPKYRSECGEFCIYFKYSYKEIIKRKIFLKDVSTWQYETAPEDTIIFLPIEYYPELAKIAIESIFNSLNEIESNIKPFNRTK